MDEREMAELKAMKELTQMDQWAVLERQTLERIDQLKAGLINNATDEKSLYFFKGVYVTLQELATLKARLDLPDEPDPDMDEPE